MAAFLVLIPPGARKGDEKARIVRDRFSWLALFLPVIWLLWHRAWLAAALAFAVQALGSAVADHPVFGLAGLGLCLATSLLVALEGPSMVVAGLERRGWTVDAVISADDRATAEDIYDTETPAGEAQTRESVSLPASETSRRQHAPMLGLVGFKEGR
ncbi:DUF2628 domain-containing protein [Shinella zoogloeoides]|uniref:DUF2628 domain-containing protein n=1 Tax=Shinella zoogloeoides TaxID=352475 RepID=A0A6N8TCP7_SHIZO|nr:DUF2628 domain-containing protein [Shinella zoogloeoides]MXO00719.1 DUF2628 domain-containing protein [Shinella zoogloeoides]UEX81361.1 DUF2628 domain-containing protein [Shinella zoogloeoides]